MADETPLSDEERAQLVAYLDGEADEATQRELEARLSRDPQARAEAEALQRTWALLDFLPKPEPSTDFTTRTLSRVGAVRPAPSAWAATVPTTARAGRRWAWWAGTAAAVTVAVALGFVAGRRPATPAPPADPESDPLLVQDLRVIDNLSLYAAADSLEFLKALDDPDLFGEDAIGR
jgi:anti-sigma factor RsiW